ncbi:hypothetical protein K7432_014952 [Basidiobolus ranarum]|uniref:Uncharacterized protein n=1 Tax=Basidiobolus ranarum TaxID=34480 RepID=A0ABR2WGT9_9FUNG
MARLHDNTLFMVSAGPLSEALIYNMYIANPYSNQYIDFGSSLDVFGKRNNTRWYTPRVSTQHACPFAYGRDLKEGNNKDNRGLLMKQVYEPTPAQLAEYEEEKKSGN